MLEFNVEHGLLFFRISSSMVPFASHRVNTAPWRSAFASQFAAIGSFIARHHIRISTHPDQFTLINSPSEEIFNSSATELVYHADMMELLHLDESHKIQIHVGGVYGNKDESTKRFIERYGQLPDRVKQRLVIENDDRLYNLYDCLAIRAATGVPVLFDSFHHELNSKGMGLRDAFAAVSRTWLPKDGVPMVDYSSQESGKRPGTHCIAIDLEDFRRFLKETSGFEFDLMLEIKNKEQSALLALAAMRAAGRG